MNKERIGKRVTFEYGYGVRVDKEPHGPYPIFGSNGATGYINSFRVQGPGVIIGRKGSVGKVAYSDKDFTPTDTTYYLNILDKSKDDLKFWYYFLQILGLERLNTHSAVPGLSRELAYLLEIKIPSIDIQKNAASVLSLIDSKIDCNNRINKELESLTKILYDYWFVQFDFPDENGKPYKTSGGKVVYNNVLKREIPAQWINSNILAIANVLGGGTPTKKKPEFWGGSIPFFTPTDADGSIFKFSTTDYITDEGLAGSSTKLFDRYTVFITARGSVGKLVLAGVDMAMNQSCYALRPKAKIGHVFLYFIAKELIHHLQVKSSGSVFDSIVSNDIELTHLAIPSVNLIQEFSAITEPMFEKISNNTKENELLAKLRDWLLPMLMNGQVKII